MRYITELINKKGESVEITDQQVGLWRIVPSWDGPTKYFAFMGSVFDEELDVGYAIMGEQSASLYRDYVKRLSTRC